MSHSGPSLSLCSFSPQPTGHTGWGMSPQGLVGPLGASGATEQSKDSVGTMNSIRSEWIILRR